MDKKEEKDRPDSVPVIPAPYSSLNGKLPAEILEWARQQVREEDVIAGIKDIHETGGFELKDFLAELERAAFSDE
jgi:hypothetical protein